MKSFNFNHLIVAFIIISCVTFAVYLYKLETKHIDSEFNGTIEKVKIDEKGYPSFFIDNDTKWILIPQAIGSNLKVGDSLSKKQDESTIYVYRSGKLITKYY